MTTLSRCPQCRATEADRPRGFVAAELELSVPAECLSCGWRDMTGESLKPKPSNPDPPSLRFAILGIRWTFLAVLTAAAFAAGFVAGAWVRGGS